MINLHFNIRNPFSDRFELVRCWSGKTPFKNKFWEFQLDKTADIIGLDLRFTSRQNHAGLFLCLAFLGYEAIFNFYDGRHWDYESNNWKNH